MFFTKSIYDQRKCIFNFSFNANAKELKANRILFEQITNLQQK